MPMSIKTAEQLPKFGKFGVIYGPTGVGKTTSLIQTGPKPLLHINTEPRSARDFWVAAGSPKDVEFVDYTDWNELKEFLETNDFSKYKTIVFDGLSHFMGVGLMGEIEDEAHESRSKKGKVERMLMSQAKMTEEGYGILASLTSRIVDPLGRLSKTGICVVMTAREDQRAKWDRTLAAAPLLSGRKFPNEMPGYLDFIGRVETRYDNSGKIVFPPTVIFDGEGFMAKWTGVRPKTEDGSYMPIAGPLDLEKILAKLQGEEK